MSWKAAGFIKEMLSAPNGEKLTRDEKLVALVLADYHHTQRKVAWPSIPRLAEECLMSETQIKRVLNSLTEKGVIEKIRPTIQGRGKNLEYRFPGLDEKEGPVELLPNTEGIQESAERGTEEVQKGARETTLIRKNGEQRTGEPNNPVDVKDSRFKACVDWLFKGYAFYNNKATCPFGGRDRRALKDLLLDCPKLDAPTFHVWLKNYYTSEGINPADRPSKFLPNLPSFACGPLDRYRRPMEDLEECPVQDLTRLP